MNLKNIKIGIVGAGSWGTALSNLLAKKGFVLDHWVFEKDVCEQIKNCNENKVFFPGVELSKNIKSTNDMEKAVADKDLVLVVVPSHIMRISAEKMGKYLSPNTIIVSASKGIEDKTYLLMTDILSERIPALSENKIAVLSGPSFAKEVAKEIPTIVTIASKNSNTAAFVQEIFATPYFRAYTSNDIIGVQLGGAVKNVIAIGAGIIDGMGLGLNSRAALITRGLAEMMRLGVKMGAIPRTFSGSSGLGDLVLTCTGDLSRNHTVGKKLGQGMKLNEILSGMTMVAEGVRTTKSVYDLAKKLNVEMPISEQIYKVLYEGLEPKAALDKLTSRALRSEFDEF